jgi:hypothetical protein
VYTLSLGSMKYTKCVSLNMNLVFMNVLINSYMFMLNNLSKFIAIIL